MEPPSWFRMARFGVESRLPWPLAYALMLGRRVRKGDRVLDPEAQIIGEFIQLFRPPGPQTVNPALSRPAYRMLVGSASVPLRKSVHKRTIMVKGAAEPISACVYTPKESWKDKESLPLLVYFHGGGWIQGDLVTHESICSEICARSPCIVVAVAYRLAPEHRFPAGVDDCIAAYQRIARSAEQLGSSPDNLFIGGDSAGGNITAILCHTIAAEPQLPSPRGQILIYPAVDMHMDSESFEDMKDAMLLDRDRCLCYRDLYLGKVTNSSPLLNDWRVSPIFASEESFAKQPPALILSAGFDPLRDDAAMYHEKLKKHGVPSTLKEYSGQIHGFLHFSLLARDATRAFDDIAQFIRGAASP